MSHRKRFLEWSENDGAYHITSGDTVVELVTPEEFVERKNAGEDISYYTSTMGKVIINNEGKQNIKVLEAVPSGIFAVVRNSDGYVNVRPEQVSTDDYIPMSDTLDQIISDIRHFLNARESYAKVGIAWHRGMLLYGPPGNGKTRTLLEAAKQFKDQCRVLTVKDVGMTRELKGLLSDMPTICIMEELTESIERYGAQDTLNFLDGVDAWPNTMCIATTNYPEKLQANIVDRPSRFDRVIKIDNPDKKAREAYLSKFLNNCNQITLADLVEITDGMSVAYLKELVVQQVVYGRAPLDVIREFKDRKAAIKREFTGNDRAGF